MNKELKKLNIGICRPAPLSLISNVYEENDINVHFVRGIIDMFSENNIFIKSPLNNEEEKVFNNQKIFIKHPFLKALTYNPYEKEDLDILFIFSKDSFEKKYLINDYLSYDEHIKHLIEQNENAICVYIQYNDVYFEVDNIKNRFITIFNAPQESELYLLNKFYMGKNVETYCLDLNELIFSNRISNKENFYNKVRLFNIKDKLDYSELKTPNSMNEGIYTLNEFNNGDDNEYIKNDDTTKNNLFLEKLQNCNFVIFDNNQESLYYNPYYYLISNYTYPVLLNKDIKHYFDIEDVNYYNYIDIDSYYSQKYLKTIRIEFKNYFKKYDLKSKLQKILSK